MQQSIGEPFGVFLILNDTFLINTAMDKIDSIWSYIYVVDDVCHPTLRFM